MRRTNANRKNAAKQHAYSRTDRGSIVTIAIEQIRAPIYSECQLFWTIDSRAVKTRARKIIAN